MKRKEGKRERVERKVNAEGENKKAIAKRDIKENRRVIDTGYLCLHITFLMEGKFM
jgi:hypothetical protein